MRVRRPAGLPADQLPAIRRDPWPQAPGPRPLAPGPWPLAPGPWPNAEPPQNTARLPQLGTVFMASSLIRASAPRQPATQAAPAGLSAVRLSCARGRRQQGVPHEVLRPSEVAVRFPGLQLPEARLPSAPSAFKAHCRARPSSRWVICFRFASTGEFYEPPPKRHC